MSCPLKVGRDFYPAFILKPQSEGEKQSSCSIRTDPAAAKGGSRRLEALGYKHGDKGWGKDWEGDVTLGVFKL